MTDHIAKARGARGKGLRSRKAKQREHVLAYVLERDRDASENKIIAAPDPRVACVPRGRRAVTQAAAVEGSEKIQDRGAADPPVRRIYLRELKRIDLFSRRKATT
jgi:hypothetical protein